MPKRQFVSVKILAPTSPGQHLGGLSAGDYFRFKDPDDRKSAKWDNVSAFQILGLNRGPQAKYARVIEVETGLAVDNVPRDARVEKLRLVTIELQPDPKTSGA